MKKYLLAVALAIVAFGVSTAFAQTTTYYKDSKVVARAIKVPSESWASGGGSVRFVELCVDGITYYASHSRDGWYVLGSPKLTVQGTPPSISLVVCHNN